MVSKIKQNKLLIRIQAFLLVFVVAMMAGLNPVFTAEAADAHTYYIQAALDTSNWTFVAGVVNDKNGFVGNYTEVTRIGGNALKELVTDNSYEMFADKLGSGDDLPETEGGNGTDNRVLSFPGFDPDRDWIVFTPQASDAQAERANYVKDSLIYDLNTAMQLVFGENGRLTYQGDSDTSPIIPFRDDLVSLLNAVESEGSVNGWTVTHGVGDPDFEGDEDSSNDEYITLSNGSESHVLRVSVKKYSSEMPASDLPDGGADNPTNDTKYVTWGTIAYEAIVNSTLEEDAVTSGTVYNPTSEGVLESAIISLMAGLVDGIRSILGLWDLDNLVFNDGVRGTTSYVSGVFPASWQSYVWTFFLIAEILSIAIIMFAIIKNVLSRAAATVNPVVRASAMDQVKDMAITVIILAILPVVIIAVMRLSGGLTDIFSNMVGERTISDSLGHFSTGSSFGAIALGIIYLVVMIYFNFFYIARGLIAALLICVAPVCITLMCIGQSGKRKFSAWIVEFLATVFIQPIHAMIFAFILVIPYAGRPIETIVSLYLAIKLGQVIRRVLFPTAGDFANSFGERAGRTASGYSKRAMMASTGFAVGAVKGGLAARREKKEAQNAAEQENGNGNGNGSDTAGGENIRSRNVDTNSAASTPEDPRAKMKRDSENGAGAVDGPSGIDQADGKDAAEGSAYEHNGDENVQADAAVKADGRAVDADGKTAQPDPSQKKSHPLSEDAAGSEKITGTVPDDGTASEHSGTYASESNKDNLSDTMTTNGKALTNDDPTKAAIRTQQRAANMATAKMIAAGALTGAVRGWHGQIFSGDPTRSAMGLNARRDLHKAVSNVSRMENAAAQAAYKTGQANETTEMMKKMFADYTPGASFQPESSFANDAQALRNGVEVGDQSILNKESLANAGINNLRRTKDGMQYTASLNNLPQDARQNIMDAMNTPEGRALAEKQGYEIIPHMENGNPNGDVTVKVRDNEMTGQRIPGYNKDTNEVITGGDYQTLVPNMQQLQQNEQDVVAAENYLKQCDQDKVAMDEYNSRVNNASAGVEQDMNSQISRVNQYATDLNTSNGAANAAWRSMRDNNVSGKDSIVSVAASGGQYHIDSGNASASVSAETLERTGIRDMEFADDGRSVSYTVSKDTTNAQLSPIIKDMESADQSGFGGDYKKLYENNNGIRTEFKDAGDGNVRVTRTITDNGPNGSGRTFGQWNGSELKVTNKDASFIPHHQPAAAVGARESSSIGSNAFFKGNGSKIREEEIRKIRQDYGQKSKEARNEFKTNNPPPVTAERTKQVERGLGYLKNKDKKDKMLLS